jgi:serine/threonine protein kinase
MLEPGSVLQDRYRIVRLLSQGGMGMVYEAADRRLDMTVAVKECFFEEEKLVRQFEREARLLARLRHHALTRVFDHFHEGRNDYLVMEFVPGEDLAERLKSGERFPVDTVLDWADDLLGALEYLHSQTPPVIHRDIKPQNLKVRSDGGITLLDFGLAKGYAESDGTTGKSVFGYTPNYAPLEQIHGLAGTDARSDLYAFAATLYHLLTGVTPPGALLRVGATSDGDPDPLKPPQRFNPEIGGAVGEVVIRAMAISREKRMESAAVMRQELRRAREIARTDPAPTVVTGAAPLPPPSVVPGSDSPSPTPHASGPPLPAAAAVASPAPLQPRRRSVFLPLLLIAFVLTGVAALLFYFLRDRTPQRDVLPDMPVGVRTVTITPTPEDVSKGTLVTPGTGQPTHGLEFSPDGRLLASASWDGSARIFSVPSMREAVVINKPGWTLSAVAFSADSRQLAIGGYGPSGSEVTLHDPVTGNQIGKTYRDPSSLMSRMSWRNGLLFIAAGSRTSVWNPATGQQVGLVEGDVNPSLAVSSDGRRVILASTNVNDIWVKSPSGALEKTLTGHTSGLLSLAISPDDSMLLSGGYDNTVKMWDLRTGTFTQLELDPPSAVFSLAFRPDGLMAAGGDHATIYLWDVRSRALKRKLNLDNRGIAYSLAFSPDGTRVAAGGSGGAVVVFSL